MISLEFEHLLTIVSLLVGVLAGLLGLLWSNLTKRIDRFESTMQDRLRTLGHEDRDIRQQIANYITANDMNAMSVENALDKIILLLQDKMD